MEFEQLVINLKPAQLANLRLMAEAADSLSLEEFVTQKVLSLLAADMETDPDSIDTAQQKTGLVTIDGDKWEQVISDLSRLRQELGVFAKESAFDLDESLPEPALTSLENISPELEAIQPNASSEPSPTIHVSASADNKSASGDPLDDLLEETLVRLQAKERSNQIRSNPVVSIEKTTNIRKIEEDEAETLEQKEPRAAEPAQKDELEDGFNTSSGIIKESPFDRSGGFPPKKRNS